jgi:hypothetical protein
VVRSASLSLMFSVPVLPAALPTVTLPAVTTPVVMVVVATSPDTSPTRKLPESVWGDDIDSDTVPRL